MKFVPPLFHPNVYPNTGTGESWLVSWTNLTVFSASLSLHPGRGEGLEARHHHQADPARYPGPPQRPQHQGPRPGRGLHLLLSEQSRLREEGPRPGQGYGCRVKDLMWRVLIPKTSKIFMM